ncbi:MAG: response regulator, partial [Bdellovibrionales bacterium]|nr:response regulator [Bdellovibrionales bacterium]
AALQARTNFLANLSHELKTPLNAVLLQSQLLSETIQETSVKKDLELIAESSKVLLMLIDDLLDLGTSSNTLRTISSRFSVAHLIEVVEFAMEPSVLEKELVFVSEIDANVPRFLIGDSGRIKQVLLHLLSNAVKFTEPGGAIALHVQNKGTEGGGDSVRLHFAVIDSGVGINEGELSSVFEPFNQVDNSITRARGGAGIGLTITMKIVEALKGKMHAASQLGTGSVFSFEVPCRIAKTVIKAIPISKERAQDDKPVSVLIVEDNPVNQKLLSMLLRKESLDYQIADNGQQALNLCRESKFDIILMDIQMPVMNGIAATQELREREQQNGSYTPIVAVTAHAMKGDKEKYLNAGMDAYISKPIDRSILMDTITTFTSYQRKDRSG